MSLLWFRPVLIWSKALALFHWNYIRQIGLCYTIFLCAVAAQYSSFLQCYFKRLLPLLTAITKRNKEQATVRGCVSVAFDDCLTVYQTVLNHFDHTVWNVELRIWNFHARRAPCVGGIKASHPILLSGIMSIWWSSSKMQQFIKQIFFEETTDSGVSQISYSSKHRWDIRACVESRGSFSAFSATYYHKLSPWSLK